MNIIELNGSVESTEDCKNLLNKHVGVKKCKRIYKLGNLRCFTNEDKKLVTIAENGEGEFCAFVDVDAQNEIKAIRNISKFYYTTDYGDVYYNPYTKTIHIVGGDGGYCYSETKLGEEDMEDYDVLEKNFKEFNSHPETSFIQHVIWADEYMPEEEGFMLIGKINDVC